MILHQVRTYVLVDENSFEVLKHKILFINNYFNTGTIFIHTMKLTITIYCIRSNFQTTLFMKNSKTKNLFKNKNS